jgi:phosphatidylglycerol---prolipoprotein diacylglyceryl transferase
MLPTLYEVDINGQPIGLHPYGMFILLAFCSAFILAHLRAMRVGIHPDRLLPVYVSAAVGGMIGGKILYAFAVQPAETLADPMSLLSFSGFAVYGGVIGGALTVAATAVFLGIPPLKLADIAAPSVVVGMGVGRIGCFFAGCCHGAVANIGETPRGLIPEGTLHGQLWLSNVFPFLTQEFNDGVGRLHDLPLYPTQIWDATLLLGLTALLLALYPYRKFDGQIAATALILQPPIRILVETFRADERGYVMQWEVSESMARRFPGMVQAGADLSGGTMGITTSQTLGLVAMGLGVVLFVVLARFFPGVAPEIPIVQREMEDLD